MRAHEAVRLFEEKLLPLRTVAAANEAFEDYDRRMLPPGTPKYDAIAQGYAQGYQDAMLRVTRMLTQVQRAVIQETRNG